MTDAADSSSPNALRICLTGCVQGLGVRPAIARQAASLGLLGSVRNTLAGLEIEIQGDPEKVTEFQQRLAATLPLGSCLDQLQAVALTPSPRAAFVIQHDDSDGPLATEVPRDAGVCDRCLAEVRDPHDRRHAYPLTTCATCGPRFTLIRDMPFDRRRTTMEAFPLCDRCREEYNSANDRRYHAQTIGCPQCGPQVWLADADGRRLAVGAQVVAAAAQRLLEGRIVAMLGVGGYQLLCDATSTSAVERLRRRKARPAKPFAVLVKSLAAARRHATIDDIEAQALSDRSNPIVLLRAASNSIASAVYPGLNKLGLMLPSTPLHAMLCDAVDRPLVCTSANREGEPLEYQPAAAAANLAGIADVWLHHDRPIARPIDDSVVQVIAGRQVSLRLGRGLAPLRLTLPEARPQLAVGGHMKSAMAWHNGSHATLGPHIGDLDSLACRERFAQQVTDIRRLYRFEPLAAVHDLHPDYFPTRFCHDLAAQQRDLELSQVQHHAAHVAAGMLEHDLLDRTVLGVSWDGTGLGTDQTIWGGEFLIAQGAREFERVAHLRPFRWFGGETAVHQPWRIAVSLLREAFPDQSWRERAANLWPGQPLDALLRIHRHAEQGVQTTSAGRLFDGVAEIVLGLQTVQYEGQAAMMLESVASVERQPGFSFPVTAGQLDWRPMLREIWNACLAGIPAAVISARFHQTLATGIVAVAGRFPELPVVLAGGVFQNNLLTQRVLDLVDDPTRLKLPGRIPPNDGGLAAGQLAVAVMRERVATHAAMHRKW